MLFGLPVLKIRAVIRHAMNDKLWGKNMNEIYEKVSGILKTNSRQAKKLVGSLIVEGYLNLKKQKFNWGTQFELIASPKGRQFGLATAALPISRQNADQLLSDLIERAKKINANDDLVYYVGCLRVFGSFLSGKETLGDLDIGFKLVQKYEGDEFKKHKQARIEFAIDTGRHFNNYVEQLCWPRDEIIKTLKARKRSLSLHDLESDDVFSKTVSKIVYMRD